MDSENKISVPTADINKPFKFEGLHFKRWKQGLFFYLTTQKLAAYCDSVKPAVVNPATTENTNAIANWVDEDFLCKNYILNAIADDLYDYYSSFGTAKEIWDALQKKYDTEEAGTKKHAVAILIDKLPPLWKDFEKNFCHKTKEFSMETLIARLHIEEEARRQDQNEEVLIVSNKRNHSSAALKSKGKITKPNHNRNGKLNLNKKLPPPGGQARNNDRNIDSVFSEADLGPNGVVVLVGWLRHLMVVAVFSGGGAGLELVGAVEFGGDGFRL
ncbi:hypothetical protein Vadar_022259 [Vaccinium darrowii]|uniref:Uncharacterized protein n=1 Tax=Vaccinium darrowii TaxID=229202 RepID=A0ACB7Y0Y2_9ERIC|nr:hypothetical protein Vadar_022259 [Vaccinium darrowii]